MINRRTTRFYFLSFLKHDLKSSVTVFFVALPLCLGISLASGAPLYSGLIAGITGGLIVTLFSKSQLSVSGPAAGLTAICAAAIERTGSVQLLFDAVMIAGACQFLLGILRLGGFTHLIPSAVIKGMLAAIGLILVFKQIPLLIGYSKADFWRQEFFNILTMDHIYSHLESIYMNTSSGAILIALIAFILLFIWKKYASPRWPFIPASFVVVLSGAFLAAAFANGIPEFSLSSSQFVHMPENLISEFRIPSLASFADPAVLKTGLVICFVATLETLLSIEAVDKLDPYNRISPQNRELMAQGTGNLVSGLLGGLPITAVIVRSSANVEAGGRTRQSAFLHGVWLLLLSVFAVSILNRIPYCVLAVILVRTGLNLAKPSMIRSVYRQGREQFLPFIMTVVAILFTDLLIGVCLGIIYAAYFILKNTYKAGYKLEIIREGHTSHYVFHLAINVSFINKKKLKDELEKIPVYSIVEIDGTRSSYIDYDVLEVINEFRLKARHKHIQLELKKIPEVEIISVH